MEIKTTSGRVFRRRKKKEQPEAPVKKAICQYLEFKGWYVMANIQSQFTQGKLRGRPDLEALKRGYVIFIETKAPARFENGRWLPEGKLRDDQVAYIDDLVRHKGKVFVTSSSEEFMRELDELEERLWPGENLKRLC